MTETNQGTVRDEHGEKPSAPELWKKFTHKFPEGWKPTTEEVETMLGDEDADIAELPEQKKTTVVELGDGQTVEFEVVDDTPRPTYELKTHDMPTSELSDARSEWIAGFAEVAPAAGLSQPMAQSLLDAVVDASSHFNVAQDLTNAEQADTLLRSYVGDEAATTILGKAQAFVRSKPKLGAYLDQTGLGNDIGVLMSLAMAADGVYALTPAKAQAELSNITSDPKSAYYSTDARKRKLAVLRVGVLSRIVHGEVDEEKAALNAAFTQSAKEKLAPAEKKSAPDAVAVARREAAHMLGDRESPLNKFRPGDPRRADAQRRYFELLNIIAP
jgi:hypothetical protein